MHLSMLEELLQNIPYAVILLLSSSQNLFVFWLLCKILKKYLYIYSIMCIIKKVFHYEETELPVIKCKDDIWF